MEEWDTTTRFSGVPVNQGLGGVHPHLRRGRCIGLALLAILCLILSLLFPLKVYAINNPDSVEFINTYCFRNLYESGDFLIVSHYNIAYASTPTTSVDNAFVFRLMDTDGSTMLGSNTAYPFADNGYGQGVVSIYFPAASAPTWGSAYILMLSESPVYFASPVDWTYTLTSADYTSETTQAGNQAALATKVLDIAMDLEIAWDATLLDLTDAGVCLSSTGESYFRYSIPGLQVMAPTLFYYYVQSPDFTEETWGTNQSTNYTTRFDDSWVGQAIDDAASLFQINTSMIGGIFILGACIAFIVVSAKTFQTTLPGFIAGIAITLAGGIMGWIAPAMLGVIALFAALYLGYFLLYNRG